MLARQRELGGGETGRHPRAFAGDAPGIDRGEADSQNQRRPKASQIERRQVEIFGRRPGQRIVHHRYDGRGSQRNAAEYQRIAEVERRGRDDDGCDEHQGEGVGDAARQIEQNRELQHIVGEIDCRFAIGETMTRRIAQGENDIEPGAERHASKALGERQRIAKTEIDHEQRRRLSGGGHPTQIRQSAQTDAAAHRRNLRRRHGLPARRLHFRVSRLHAPSTGVRFLLYPPAFAILSTGSIQPKLRH